MLVLNNSSELGTTYLQVFLLWMVCSELALSFDCFHFVVTGNFMPFWGLSILRGNLVSTEKSEWGWADRGKHRLQKGFAVNSNTVGLVLGTW